MKRRIIVTLVFMSMTMLYAAENAGEIAKKSFDLREPNDLFTKATMTIIDSNKNQKVREFEMQSKKKNAVTNMFIRFLAPADVRNTKFLTLGSSTGKDEQRIYLPALKKTRKIAASDKNAKFVGSDMFYYDMETKKFEDYEFVLLKEQATLPEKQFEGMEFYILEQRSKTNDSPYSKSIVYQNKKNNFIYKSEAFDKNGNLWKTLYVLGIKESDGVLIPSDTLIVNHIDNSKTRMQVSDIKTNIGVSDAIFTIQNLEK